MDVLLQGLAERQRGLFTTFQARGAGLDDCALSALVRHGGARHLARGLYALPVQVYPEPRGRVHRTRLRWTPALSRRSPQP